MVSKKALVILGVIVSAFAVVACAGNGANLKGVAETSTAANDEDLVLTMEAKDISDVENGKIYQNITYSVLEYRNNLAMQKSLDELNEESKTAAEKFKKDNKQYVREYINGTGNRDAEYAYNSDMTFSHHGEKYLSIVEKIYINTMGAHPITIVKGHTYDVETGKKLTLNDFITDTNELKSFLKDWVKNQKEDYFYPEAGEAIDKYFNGEYEMQFALYGNEFHVIFQQYDIAPYAAGIIEVNVDKKLLKVDLNDI